MGTKARLSVMMALAYAVQGAWWPILALHLNSLGISERHRGWLFATLAMAAIVAPPIAGRIADRSLAAQRLLSLLYAAGSIVLAFPGDRERDDVRCPLPDLPRVLADPDPVPEPHEHDRVPQPREPPRGVWGDPPLGHRRLDGGGLGRLGRDAGRGVRHPRRVRRRRRLVGPHVAGVAHPAEHPAARHPRHRVRLARGRIALEDSGRGRAAGVGVPGEPHHAVRVPSGPGLPREARRARPGQGGVGG